MKNVMNNVQRGVMTILFLTISAVGFSQLALDKAPIAKISLEAPSIDYGVIKQGSDGTRTIQFTNTGDAPLLIAEVKASCGCTVPSFSKAPVMPNQTGEITVKYDTKKLGTFSKTVTILSNAEGAKQTFKISGTVTE